MTRTANRILVDALGLSEDERVHLAAEILASVEGPADADWESAWLAELDRRAHVAGGRTQAAAEWSAVKADILARLQRR